MEYRKLGNADINVSVFSIGSWNTFEFMDERSGVEVLASAIDAGVNFLDDARYTDTSGKAPIKTGYSEVVFGNLLRAGGWNRDDLILSNRLWLEFYPEESIEKEIDGSLSRIGIDDLDLVYCMDPPETVSLPKLIQEIGEVIKTGKIKYWGIANWSAGLLAEGCVIAKSSGIPLPCAAMLPYSLLRRSWVEDAAMASICAENNIGIVPSFCLAGGVLTGKYNQTNLPAKTRRNAEQIAELRKDGTLDKVDKFIELAKATGYSPAQLALAFCLKNEQVSSLLFGATSVAQVTENLSALQAVNDLNEDVFEHLTTLFD